MRVCPKSTDGRHYGVRKGGFIYCMYCPASQVYSINPGENWVVRREH